MRRKIFACMAAFAFLLFLAGCSGGSGEGSKQTQPVANASQNGSQGQNQQLDQPTEQSQAGSDSEQTGSPSPVAQFPPEPAALSPPQLDFPPPELPSLAIPEEQSSGSDMSEPGAHPIVLLETSLGQIKLELFPDKAPQTVGRFLECVEQGFYDGTIFHQVIPGVLILGGQYTVDYQAKQSGPAIPCEADNGLKNRRGTVAMFRQYNDVNSATCQFFINVRDNPNLDHQPLASTVGDDPEAFGYCVFGQVVEGIEVVDRIAAVPVHDAGQFELTPVEPVVIIRASRLK